MQTVRFKIHDEHAPALLAAIEEISETVATRAEGKFTIPQEAALTRALAALPALRLATARAVQAAADAARSMGLPGYRIIEGPDPDYPRDR